MYVQFAVIGMFQIKRNTDKIQIKKKNKNNAMEQLTSFPKE